MDSFLLSLPAPPVHWAALVFMGFFCSQNRIFIGLSYMEREWEAKKPYEWFFNSGGKLPHGSSHCIPLRPHRSGVGKILRLFTGEEEQAL
jgi:hypothetical protein